MNFFQVLFFSFAGIFNSSNDTLAFQKHLQDAIIINKERTTYYALYSHGESLKISKHLIKSEKQALLIARYFDNKSLKLENKGIEVLKDVFVSMTMINDIQDYSQHKTEYCINQFNINELKEIRKALYKNVNELNLVVEEALTAIDVLDKKEPYYNMYKHVLESIVRVCYIAKENTVVAEQKNIKGVKRYYNRLLGAHLYSLRIASKIDQLAYPIQQKGIYIIKNDVPDALYNIEQLYN